jgi:hypothetical protein
MHGDDTNTNQPRHIMLLLHGSWARQMNRTELCQAKCLTRHHSKNIHALGVISKVQPPYAIEALAHVRLRCLHILGLRKDLQQLIIGQEVKPAPPACSIVWEVHKQHTV